MEKETKTNWISIMNKLPLNGSLVLTKIESNTMGDWCFINRIYHNGKWIVLEKKYEKFNEDKYNPTHWSDFIEA